MWGNTETPQSGAGLNVDWDFNGARGGKLSRGGEV